MNNITISDLIRREGREPGGKPCTQVWVVKWAKGTQFRRYPPAIYRAGEANFQTRFEIIGGVS